MPKIRIQKYISASDWEAGKYQKLIEDLLKPRDDIVLEGAVLEGAGGAAKSAAGAEAATGTGELNARFDIRKGPFEEYHREVSVERTQTGEQYLITETYEFKLAVPVWKIALTPLVKRALKNSSALSSKEPLGETSQSPKNPPKHPPKKPANPWWAPSTLLDERAARVLAFLCLLSLIAGYYGTLLSQTITFVGDDFGADTSTQGYMLAAIRVGVILALVITAAADRYGRRRLISLAAIGACLFTLFTAASVDIISYAAFQTLARALSTSFALLLGIMAAEETPAGARAYAASVLSLSAALGSGVVVWLLPVADMGESAWRILYLVPVLTLFGLVPLLRALPETTRFQKTRGSPDNKQAPNNKQKLVNQKNRARLALLGAASFFLALFIAPASQFQNEFLRDERGFSGAKLTLFQLSTNTPAGVGVFLGGKLADLKGRRLVGVVGLLGATSFITLRYLVGGWSMWMWSGLGAVMGAAMIPALGVYGPELFSTANRGRFGGALAVIAVAGSALGLILVGWLSDVFDFGRAFSIIAIAPLIVVVLVLLKFPETANIELEELNPEDK